MQRNIYRLDRMQGLSRRLSSFSFCISINSALSFFASAIAQPAPSVSFAAASLFSFLLILCLFEMSWLRRTHRKPVLDRDIIAEAPTLHLDACPDDVRDFLTAFFHHTLRLSLQEAQCKGAEYSGDARLFYLVDEKTLRNFFGDDIGPKLYKVLAWSKYAFVGHRFFLPLL